MFASYRACVPLRVCLRVCMCIPQTHDDEARTMALAAQDFALKYLSKRARTCYWFKLVSEFAKLLNYT